MDGGPVDYLKVQLAFSWEIAAQLAAWFPDHRVYELHPAGGTYDCLSLRGPRAEVDVNRTGSTTVHNVRPHGTVVPHDEMFELAVAPCGADVVVGRVLECFGIPSGRPRPPTTPQALTYRVVAAVLTSRLVGDADWDCRSLFLDSSGDGDSSGPDAAPVPEFADVPMNEVWVLTRDHIAVAHLWDGWAVTASGERWDLMARYDAGSTIDALAAALTAKPATRSAPALPASAARRQADPRFPSVT
jgi:hypothetical protein